MSTTHTHTAPIGRSAVADVTIVPLTPTEVPQAVALDAAVHRVPWAESVLTAELAQDSRRYLGAIQHGRLLGFGGTLLAVDEVHVTTLVIDPQQHRRKLATRLLLALLADAMSRGATAATLEVRATNRGAQRLYTAFGFAPVAVRAGYYDGPRAAAHDDREDAIIMWAYDITGSAYGARLADQQRRLDLPGGASGAPDLPVPHNVARIGLRMEETV